MKILWIGDGGVPTGFGTVTHALCHEFIKHGHDVVVLGISYEGDPHPYPWRMYPAVGHGANIYGMERVPEIFAKEKPDVVCFMNDSWVLSAYLAHLQEILPQCPPMVAYVPVDAENQWAARKLNALAHVIAYTVFGARELRKGGYRGPISIAPHGIDGSQFYPEPNARETLKGFPSEYRNKFIIGNVNRNQPRKRLDITAMAFAHFWNTYGRPDDVALLFHCAIVDAGWDMIDLCNYLGLASAHIIYTGVKDQKDITKMATPDRLRLIYNVLDVQVNSSLGEGWGLTTMEGMACGVRQIVPRHSAFEEWAAPYVKFCDVGERQAHIQGINTFSPVPSIRHLAYLMAKEYFDWRSHGPESPDEREMRSIGVVQKYQWPEIAQTFLRVFSEVTQ